MKAEDVTSFLAVRLVSVGIFTPKCSSIKRRAHKINKAIEFHTPLIAFCSGRSGDRAAMRRCAALLHYSFVAGFLLVQGAPPGRAPLLGWSTGIVTSLHLIYQALLLWVPLVLLPLLLVSVLSYFFWFIRLPFSISVKVDIFLSSIHASARLLVADAGWTTLWPSRNPSREPQSWLFFCRCPSAPAVLYFWDQHASITFRYSYAYCFISDSLRCGIPSLHEYVCFWR